MEWLKQHIISLLIAGYLVLASIIFADKIDDLKTNITEVKQIKEQVIPELRVMITEIKTKMDNNDVQRFGRYEEILNDIQKKFDK